MTAGREAREENEPRKRTERGKEAGSRKGRLEETKVGRAGRDEGREPEETRGNGKRNGRVEATVRRKLEAGKGRNRDQVAES